MTHAVPELRVRPAPASEPPYEDDGAHSAPEWPRPTPNPSRGVQGTLALSFSLPSGAPATPHPPASLRLVQSSHGDAPPPEPGTHPPERPWACRFVQALIEVLAGARPVTQLLHWTSPEVYERVRRRAAVPGGWSPNPNVRRRARLHSVRLSRPRGNIMEVCAVVRGGGRARAIALRLEEAGGHWRCTQLELG